MTERQIQRAILDHLYSKGIWAVHVPNGSVLAGDSGRRARQMNALKADGLRPGFPDLIVYGPQGRIGHLEIKKEGVKQQPSQVDCEARLKALGQHYAVCRSVADVDETLAEWGWG